MAHPPAGIAASKDDLQIMVGMAVGVRLWAAKVLGKKGRVLFLIEQLLFVCV